MKLIKPFFWIPVAMISPWVLFFMTKNKMYFHDQSSVCVISQGILSGLDMYRHYFNEKLPALYYYHAFLLQFLEPDIQSIRFITYLTLSATIGLIFYLLEINNSRGYLKLFFLCLILFFLATSKSFNAATEPSLAFIYLISIILIVKDGVISLPFRNTIVGFLMGIAIGFRQHSILPALILLLMPWHKISRLYYVAGFFLGIFSWALYFIQHDLLGDMLWSTFLFTLKNKNIHAYIQPTGFLKSSFIVVAILFFISLRLLKDTPKKWLPFFAVSCSLSFFIRFGNTRLWPAFILLCTLIIMHINLLDKELVKFKASHIKGFFILLLLLIFPFKFFNEIKKSGLDKSNQMANFILEHSSPTDSILAYPGDPGLYCLTKRQPASRFYFLAPWLASEEILNTVVRDIRTNKPKLIVLRKDFEADLNFLPIHQEIWSQYEIHGGEEGLSQYSIYQLKKDVIPTQ